VHEHQVRAAIARAQDRVEERGGLAVAAAKKAGRQDLAEVAPRGARTGAVQLDLDLRQQQLGVVVVLHLKIATLRHVPHDLRRV
jgi:hypothetical protein